MVSSKNRMALLLGLMGPKAVSSAGEGLGVWLVLFEGGQQFLSTTTRILLIFASQHTYALPPWR